MLILASLFRQAREVPVPMAQGLSGGIARVVDTDGGFGGRRAGFGAAEICL